MRALVTGGTGFVGSHLIESLVARGIEVTALVRTPAKARRLTELGVGQVEGGLDSIAALRRGAEGQDVVYHVAGLVAARNESEYMRVNADGTKRVVQAAKDAAVPRFVMVSSLAAAGPSEPGNPLRNDEPTRPVTAYGRSKLAGEAVVRGSDLPWCIVRPPIVYGPRDRELLRVFKSARLGLAPVFGQGTQELSAVFAIDLAEALLAVATADRALERVYYPCHPAVVSSLGLVRAVGRAVGRNVRTPQVPETLGRGLLAISEALARVRGRATVLNRDKANELFQPAWTADPEPLTRDTGWRAAHDLAEGLSLTADWYRKQGWL
jgi:nucleoside-diphosphate-sugar epimerase